MRISKTIFKQYARCPRVCALDDIYKKKLQTNASIFGEHDETEKLIELLGTMFDVESGDDLIDVVDPQLDALLYYYNLLEKHAMEIAQRHFGKNIIYDLNTKNQKVFSFTDESKHQFYCYLDGYQETETEVRVFEVKATTSRKFLELGSKRKGVLESIFKRTLHCIEINHHADLPVDKFAQQYEKLFNRFSDVGRYAFDLAVERYIIENSIKTNSTLKSKKFKYYLVVLNSDYTFDGKQDDVGNLLYKADAKGNELVNFIDLTQITSEFLPQIHAMKKQIIEFIQLKQADEVPLGIYCERKKQGKCVFINTCWQKVLQPGSILEYMQNHHGFKDEEGVTHKTIDLINQGYVRIDDIPKTWLHRPNNLIQRECFDENKEFINVEKMRAGIKQITYPIYHLDFESFPCPLPRYAGEKPYCQSVFQFSLHIERSPGVCNKDVDHLEYLASDFLDHRKELVEKLITSIDLSKGGTILVYNKAFEHTRIKEFAQFFPEYEKELMKMNDHMFDLLDIVSTNSKLYQDIMELSEEESKIVNYYHNNLHGSYSIKKVLPVFSDLSYDALEVGNGTEAIAAYAMFPKLEKEDIDKVRQSLIEYCKQDTWAMVKVLWGLMKKARIDVN